MTPEERIEKLEAENAKFRSETRFHRTLSVLLLLIVAIEAFALSLIK